MLGNPFLKHEVEPGSVEHRMRREWAKILPNFWPEEILSPGQLKLFKRGILPYSKEALLALQTFRSWLGQSLGRDTRLVVNYGSHRRRGTRSIMEVIAVNMLFKEPPHRYSFHLWCAFDVHSPDCSVDEIFEYAKASGLWGGIGKYKTFIHLDKRDQIINGGLPSIWGA